MTRRVASGGDREDGRWPLVPRISWPAARRARAAGLAALTAALALSADIARAQDLTGQWQGAINPGKELRLVFVVASADGGGLRATMHSIDQGAQAIPVNVTVQGPTIGMAIAPRTSSATW